MDVAETLDVTRDTIVVLLQVSMPLLVIALVVGLVISLFQALTQIQEATLAFVPKMMVLLVSTLLLLPYMASTMTGFMERIADRIVALG